MYNDNSFTARILKGEYIMLSIYCKSRTQPDGGGPEQSRGASRKAKATKGSRNDVAVWQLWALATVLGEGAVLPRKDTANA